MRRARGTVVAACFKDVPRGVKGKDVRSGADGTIRVAAMSQNCKILLAAGFIFPGTVYVCD
jgi:hypothetical protein